MLEITISDSGTTLCHKDERGVRHTKSVDLNDLVRVLASNTKFDMGFLPIGTRYIGTRGDQVYIAVERPAARYDITYGNNETFNGVSLPAALFLFKLNKASDAYFVQNSYIYALRSDNVMLGLDPVYQYPTPNIYEEGKICWGNNEESLKNFKSLAAINSITRRFFTAPFNSDLFHMSKVSENFPSRNSHTIRSYFEFLSQNTFNSTWLQNNRDGGPKTFDEAIRNIFGAGV